MSDKKYPVKRMGNEKNPKIIILLSNPGGDPKHYKRLPEYVMDKDGVYCDAGISFSVSHEYIKWWDKILEVTDRCGIKDTEVLALEYYPYHTVGTKAVKKDKLWDDYAKNALLENINLLKKHIENRIPIFAYYRARWEQKITELTSYKKYHPSANTRGQSQKIRELEEFLKSLTQI